MRPFKRVKYARVHHQLATLVVLLTALPLWLNAQAPENGGANLDRPEVKAFIARARKTAGTQWAGAERFLCEEPRGARADDPPIPASKLFDNVYMLGKEGGEVYAITTSGGILLIGAGGANETDRLLDGLQSLGLDPAKIKIVIVSHGHADHFGGARYLQEHYGAHVYISAPDWDLMEHPPAARPAEINATAKKDDAKKAAGPPLPRHDMILAEGQPVTLGDVTVTPVSIPGHTPGSMGLIFPVQDGEKTHTAAIFGGAVLLVRVMSGDRQQYLASIAHFKEEARKHKVDVELKDYPLPDGEDDKLSALKTRQGKEPNPFVVGQASYLKFLDVMSDCFEAQIAARK